jgi:2-hydroxychromene-2-carboxylate isomerase
MITKKIDWYFDFISPFSYLQSEQIERVAQYAHVNVKPILFAPLLDHWNNVGPAEIPPKRTWTLEHCVWLAHRLGVPIQAPSVHPFNPLPLLRLSVALDNRLDVVHRLFRYVWQEGKLPAEAEHWQALLTELGVSDPAIAETPAIKERLRQNGADAIAANVFGVPTCVVHGRDAPRLFWGAEATDMLIAYLNDDPIFDSPAMRQARHVPQGIQRKRST